MTHRDKKDTTALTSASRLEGLINPPGLDRLRYRVGTASSFRREMIDRLATTQVPDGRGGVYTPLANLNLDPSTNWIIALIDAWSLIGDIETFYQERIINEGFLGTAVESLSVDLLARSIGARRGHPVETQRALGQGAHDPDSDAAVDTASTSPGTSGSSGASSDSGSPTANTGSRRYTYRVDPGVAATTDMAFTVRSSDALPDHVPIPRGTRINSHSITGGQPQAFETSAPLLARQEWNAMVPYRPSRTEAPVLDVSTMGLRVSGTQTTLAAGAPILVVGTPPQAAGAPVCWCFGTVESMLENQALEFTLITWKTSGTIAAGRLYNQDLLSGPMVDLRLYTFAKQVPIFGHDAKQFATLPVRAKMAFIESGGMAVAQLGAEPSTPAAINQDLPAAAVRAVAVAADNTLYIGTASGVYYTSPGSTAGWQAMNSGLSSTDVYALAVDDQGYLYAGTVKGGVYRTSGPNSGWTSLAGSFRLDSNNQPVKTSLPSAMIRRILPTASAVLVLCDYGLFANQLDGKGWTAVNLPVASIDTSSNDKIFEPSSSYQATPPVDAVAWEVTVTTSSSSSSTDSGSSPLPLASPLVMSGSQTDVTAYVAGDRPNPSTIAGAKCLPVPASDDGTASVACAQLTHLALVAMPDTTGSGDGCPALLASQATGVSIYVPPAPDDNTTTGASTGTFQALEDGLPGDSAIVSLAPVAVSEPAQALAVLSSGQVYGLALGGTCAAPTGSWSLEWTLPVTSQLAPVGPPPCTPAPPATPPPDVPYLVAANRSGQALMSAPIDFPSDWPGFALSSTSLDLDSSSVRPAPTSFLVAIDTCMGTQDQAVAVCETVSSQPADGSAFGLKKRITHVSMAAGPSPVRPLDDFHRRTTLVWAQASELSLYARTVIDRRPVGGRRVVVAGLFAPPEVAGPDARSGAGSDTGSGASPSASPMAALAGVGKPVAFSGLRARAVVARAGGVLARSPTDPSDPWLRAGLDLCDVRDLLPVSGTGAVYAATGTHGVYAATTPAPLAWRWQGRGLEGAALELRALAVLPDGRLLAATAAGMFYADAPAPGAALSWKSSGWPETSAGAAPQCLVVRDEVAFAGTSGAGVYTSSDGVAWTAASSGALAPDTGITALAAAPDGTVYAGSSAGAVYLFPAEQAPWQLGSAVPGSGPIGALLASDSLVLAARGADLFALDHGRGWSSAGVLPHVVTSVLVAQAGWLAGTRGGLYLSTDRGRSWSGLLVGTANDIQVLRALDSAGGTVLAGAGDRVWLDSADGLRSTPLALSRVLAIPAEPFADALDQTLITGPMQSLFERAGANLPADAIVTVDAPGHSWRIESAGAWSQSATANPSASARSSGRAQPRGSNPGSGGAPVFLLCRRDQVIDVVSPQDNLLCTAAPRRVARGVKRMFLATAAGFVGHLDADRGDIWYRPASENDDQVDEVERVIRATPVHGNQATELLLAKPLANLFDATRVTISGNVVRATQGRTVNGEILGSGNAAVANQTFKLAQPPLTFLPAPAPFFRRSTLQVLVNGLPWTEVASLYDYGPQDEVYTVAIDLQGNATITFGDGTNGALLPNGSQNITANYRSGLGPVGDVDENTLTVMPAPPVGVTSVTNPIPATGGEDPEPASAIRTRAPRQVSSLGRLVTLRDYDDFVGSYPDIGQAVAKSVAACNRTVVQVTVAGNNGAPIAADSALLSAVRASIARAQTQPAEPVQVDSYQAVGFRVSATLELCAGAEPVATCRQARQALLSAFGAVSQIIGQDVTQGDVLAVLQAVTGVAGAQVTRLRRVDGVDGSRAGLIARPARYHAADGTILAAEMLVVDPTPGGILLTPVTGAGAARAPRAGQGTSHGSRS